MKQLIGVLYISTVGAVFWFGHYHAGYLLLIALSLRAGYVHAMLQAGKLIDELTLRTQLLSSETREVNAKVEHEIKVARGVPLMGQKRDVEAIH